MATDENKNKDPLADAGTGTGGTTPPKTKEEEISISKKTLQNLLARMEANEKVTEQLLDSNKKKDQQIAMLTDVADKGRLARYMQTTQGPLIQRARIGFWEGVPILAWEKVKDEVGYRDGRMVVNQITRLFLDEKVKGKDGKETVKTVELDYLYWAQNTSSEEGDVIEKKQTADGLYWTVQLADGRKVTVDVRCLSPF